MRCIVLKISSCCSLISTPISTPSCCKSSTKRSKFLVEAEASTIIIMLKYPWIIVCEISRMLTCCSARYVQTLAMIPTLSFPNTVIIPFNITASLNCTVPLQASECDFQIIMSEKRLMGNVRCLIMCNVL